MLWHNNERICYSIHVLVANAVMGRSVDILSFILDNKPSEAKVSPMGVKGIPGGSVLSTACMLGYSDEFALLFSRGIHLDCADDLNELLNEAVRGQRGAIIKILLSNGTDPHHVRPDGLTALHIACRGGNQAIITLLLEALSAEKEKCACAFNHRDPSGHMLQIVVSVDGLLDIAKALLDGGSDVDAPCGPTQKQMADADPFGFFAEEDGNYQQTHLVL